MCDKKNCDKAPGKSITAGLAYIQSYGVGGAVAYICSGLTGLVLLGPDDKTGLHETTEMFIFLVSGAVGATLHTKYIAEKIKNLLT